MSDPPPRCAYQLLTDALAIAPLPEAGRMLTAGDISGPAAEIFCATYYLPVLLTRHVALRDWACGELDSVPSDEVLSARDPKLSYTQGQALNVMLEFASARFIFRVTITWNNGKYLQRDGTLRRDSYLSSDLRVDKKLEQLGIDAKWFNVCSKVEMVEVKVAPGSWPSTEVDLNTCCPSPKVLILKWAGSTPSNT